MKITRSNDREIVRSSSTEEGARASARDQEHGSKLSDMGGRIARVAHELNGPVSLISGSLANLEQYVSVLVQYVEAVYRQLDGDQDPERTPADLDIRYVIDNAPQLLRICTEGAQRLSYLVEQLRSYSRRGAGVEASEKVDLAAILREATRLAAQGRAVPAIETDIPELPPISGNAAALSQVFANVIANAFDATTSAANGRVQVSVNSFRREQRSWVEVRISDNGPGVPTSVRDQVFEAFFTTKARSGLGLGLAIAKETLESHGGTIELSDATGRGAEFVVRLPSDPQG